MIMVNITTHHFVRNLIEKVTSRLKIFSSILAFLFLSPILFASQPESNESSQLLSLDELKKKKVYYSIESALQNPDQVYKLSLYHNAMLALPSVIEKFDNLQVLDVSRNRLSELPEEIGELDNLQYLNVEDNQITELPKSIKNLDNLRVLNVRRNDITKLPKEIGQLQNLEELTLEYNALYSLPAEISNLKNLQTLNLKNNKLDELNEAVGSLTQLKELNIKYNEITALPGSIANLKQLDKFSINLHKFTIQEIQKYGKLLAGTDTELGRQYLQSLDALNEGEFANMEIHVRKTQKFDDKEVYCSILEYNRLNKEGKSGKGMVIWQKDSNEPAVVYSLLTEDAEPSQNLTSKNYISAK
ncbi:MAG: hypothetical protein BRD50_07205 [Bacteroidetes bacterium SW_11_45_7]|nr:MAG: hypothetical protein BRD50_07205 [Bacteroidetes bacterium SW_11_45_7]